MPDDLNMRRQFSQDQSSINCLFKFYFRSGSDSHGRPTHTRPWDDNTNSLESHKRCIKALFEFCTKLGVKYWTAFDSDLVPFSDTWEETRTNWDEVVEYIQEMTQRMHVKLLWIAPDLHSHPRSVKCRDQG